MTEMAAARMTADEFEDTRFQEWIGETSPELFTEYLRPTPQSRRDLLSHRFRQLFPRPEAEVRLLTRGDAFLGIMGHERLEWDSRHFGVECGRLSPYCLAADLSRAEREQAARTMIGGGIEWARRNETRLLQRRLLSPRGVEINVLEDMGFHLVDSVVTLAAPITDVLSVSAPATDVIELRAPTAADLEPLATLTRGAFPHSRFVNDRLLSPERGHDVYVKWLTKIVGELTTGPGAAPTDHEMIVAVRNDRVLGYVASRIDRNLVRLLGQAIATIELIVVDEMTRGTGLGQRLFREAARAASGAGAEILESSTWIGHDLALAANQKAGLRVRENMLTYHLYL